MDRGHVLSSDSRSYQVSTTESYVSAHSTSGWSALGRTEREERLELNK
jgi:hypothetical protein